MDIMVQNLKWWEKYIDNVRLTTPHIKKPPYYKMLHSPGQKAQWTGKRETRKKRPFFRAPRMRYMNKKGCFKYPNIVVGGMI